MRVRVDKSGHDHSVPCIDDFDMRINRAERSGVRNDAITHDHDSVADDAQLSHFRVHTRAGRTGERYQFGAIDDGKVHPLLQ